jgi:hypothetical protein
MLTGSCGPCCRHDSALLIHGPFSVRVLSQSFAYLAVSLDQHGASLATLYRQVEKHAKDHRTTGNLLVVRDNQGHTFGIYLNEPILKREGTYYGTGESSVLS